MPGRGPIPMGGRGPEEGGIMLGRGGMPGILGIMPGRGPPGIPIGGRGPPGIPGIPGMPGRGPPKGGRGIPIMPKGGRGMPKGGAPKPGTPKGGAPNLGRI